MPADFPADVVQTAARFSETAVRFLDFVSQNPEAMERQSFTALDVASDFSRYPLQSWPTFARREVIEEAGRATTGLVRLIASLPARHFDGDPDRLAAFYRLEPREYASILLSLFSDPAYVSGLIARGDFVLGPAGFRCVEMNMGSNLGGWQASEWVRRYLRIPVIERFMKEVRCHPRDTVDLLFEHLIDSARRRGVLGDELVVAVALPLEKRGAVALQEYGRRAFHEALARRRPPLRGDLFVCDPAELRQESGRLLLGNRPVDVLVELSDGRIDRGVLYCLLAGTLSVHNGPAAGILGDKRNLALLSEHAGSPAFSPDERALIEAHVPWTRIVRPGPVTWEGTKTELRRLLLARRSELVLKPASGARGEGVSLGRLLPPAAWERSVDEALAAPDRWVVQEFVESLPYAFQAGARGWETHRVVWGFFSFGDIYAGAFSRMLPSTGSGVINAARGASEGLLIEVEEAGGGERA